MLQCFINLRLLFISIGLLTNFNSLLSDSVWLCYEDSYEIVCADDQYIVIKEAVFGYLPSYIDTSAILKPKCKFIYTNNALQREDCGVSLMRNISNRCSGIKSCKVTALYSEYLQRNLFQCPDIAKKHDLLTLYINYECVSKDLFYSFEALEKMHFVGGYITSVGYNSQKSYDQEEFNYTANNFRNNNYLPLRKNFRPKINSEISSTKPIVFQFQILENTLYSYQKNSNFNKTNTCQMGKLYFQDYYAFTSTNNSLIDQNNNKSLVICQSSRDMVGEILQPIITEKIYVTINVNFKISPNIKKGLLIKFTTIFCPPLSIENANIIYDNKLLDDKHSNEVIGYAMINCNSGYVLFPSSNLSTKTTKTYLNCNAEKEMWDRPYKSIKCLNNLPNYEITKTNQKLSTYSTSKMFSTTIFSTSAIYSNDSVIPNSMTTTNQTVVNSAKNYIIVTCTCIFLILICIFGYILYKKRSQIKCISTGSSSFSKFFTKNENLLKLHCNNNIPNHFNTPVGYKPIMDIMTPMSGSLGLINFSPNGSCRHSNRTLITRADSRPTSRDSFAMSYNTSDFDINHISVADELPTKIPKQSPIMRILRSASNLRNPSHNTFRPTSLSRQSYGDRSFNKSDGRFSSSQLALLKNRRNNVNSEFNEIHPVMWTSDISQSKTIPKGYKQDSVFNNLSQSDISSKFNSKNYSPTIDTYLEPTLELSNQLDEEDSIPLSSKNERRRSEEYMIYDHSRISSNNIDSTCPSSVNESISDLNFNNVEGNNRFSMISNNYYGIQCADSKSKYIPTINNNVIPEITSKNNENYHNSNESVYESIDDDPVYQNTLERRKIALPPPPNED